MPVLSQQYSPPLVSRKCVSKAGFSMTGKARCVRQLPALILAPLLYACQPSEPIRLGFIGGITGSASALGTPARDGALLAVEQHNAAGGINGRQIQLIVKDDAGDVTKARQAVLELINLNVAAIIGPETSVIGVATVDIVNEHQVVMMSPTVTTTQLTAKDDYFLRVNSPADIYASETARYHFEKLGRRQLAATLDMHNRAYSETWLNAFIVEFEHLGGEVSEPVPFTSGDDANMPAVVDAILQSNPEAVLIVAGAVDAATLCQLLRAGRNTLPIIISEWAIANDEFIALGGAAVEGVYTNRFLNPDDVSPAFLNFVKDYEARFSWKPGFASVSGFEATQIVLDGLARQQQGQHLKEAILSRQSYQGIQTPILLDEYGDTVRTNYISQVKNGRLVNLGGD